MRSGGAGQGGRACGETYRYAAESQAPRLRPIRSRTCGQHREGIGRRAVRRDTTRQGDRISQAFRGRINEAGSDAKAIDDALAGVMSEATASVPVDLAAIWALPQCGHFERPDTKKKTNPGNVEGGWG